MDDPDTLFHRPSQRPRFTQPPGPGQQHHPAAPAQQQWGPQSTHPQHHADAAPAATAGPSRVCRWLACSHKAGLLGVAAYDSLSNELSVLQVADDSTGACAFQMLQYIKLQVDPQVIVLSAAAEPALVEAAKLPAAAATGAVALGDGSSAGQATVQLQRPSLFTYSKALQMLSAVRLRGQLLHARQAAASLIDTAAQQQVAALSALVAVLLQLQLQEEASDAEAADVLVVERLSEMTLDGHLVIDGPSLAALEIFAEEEHPSAMGIGSSKEGVSLFGLLQRCVTGMGRRLLRQWFLRPVVQLEVIADRHDTLEALVAAPNTNEALRAAMKKMQDLPRLLARLRLSQARPQLQTFRQLHDSISQLLGLRDILAALAPQAAAAAVREAGGTAAAAGPPGYHDGWGGRGAGAAAGGGWGHAPQEEQEPHTQAHGRQPGWLFEGMEEEGGYDADALAATPGGAGGSWGGQGAAGGGGAFWQQQQQQQHVTPPRGMFGASQGRGASDARAQQSAAFAGGSAAGVQGGAGAGAAAFLFSPDVPPAGVFGGQAAAAAAHAAVAHGAGAGAGAEAVCAQGSGLWDGLHITHKILHGIGPELQQCASLIADVLDLTCPPGPGLEGSLVQPGVCQPLDDLRATLDQLPALLTQVVEQELLRVPPHVARRYSRQLWSVVYIPQVGFVMSVSGGRLSEELCELLPDLQLAFMGEDGPPAGAAAARAAAAAEDASGLDLDRSCAYYTCEATQQLNARYGDLQHKVQDLEASICTELIKRLLQQHAPALTAASGAVAELDCLCGLADAARELGYCRPQLVRESGVVIEGGRHPLAELLAPGRFIDNDTCLGAAPSPRPADQPPAAAAAMGSQEEGSDGQGLAGWAPGAPAAATVTPRMLLITGPNASGKSVYMKQVALLVFMAHIGSFVPARSARIGLTDRILTRLPGMECLAAHTSSFMADLAQVSHILGRATHRSLVLLDEFGKGTLTSDGVGLLGAVLGHFAAAPEGPPLLLACTHFSELLDPGILPDPRQLQLCTMQVLVGGGSGGGSGAAEGGYAFASGGGGGPHGPQGADQQQQQQQGGASWEQEHVFLYKLVPGAVAASYGLHCARLCGVEPAVLMRAADVQELQQAGRPISRLQVPQLEQRDAVCWQLVQRLAGLDVLDVGAVSQLLAAVIRAESGAAVEGL